LIFYRLSEKAVTKKISGVIFGFHPVPVVVPVFFNCQHSTLKIRTPCLTRFALIFDGFAPRVVDRSLLHVAVPSRYNCTDTRIAQANEYATDALRLMESTLSASL
jgi:hypothetical protein